MTYVLAFFANPILRRNGSALLVRAFVAQNSGASIIPLRRTTEESVVGLANNRLLSARVFSSSSSSKPGVSSSPSIKGNERRQKFRSLTQSSASVEEDLDAALDDILGSAFAEAESGRPDTYDEVDERGVEHIKGSHPIPEALVEEEDPINYTDPEYLSTSNPHWVQAGLSPAIIDVLSSKGITHFTPVQGEAFSPILAGRDVIGRSRTGTGKTLAFGLPSITRLVESAEEKGIIDSRGRRKRGRLVSMLVLCPTRELARQVQEELDQVSKPAGLHTAVFHGGVSYEPQARALRMGLDILVGTPGRVIDHIKQGNLDLSECDIVVLDEADEMLNMGFAEDVEIILEGVGSANERKTQCLLFSATTPPWVRDIGRQYQEDVLSIDTTAEQGGARTATTVRHLAIQVPPGPHSKKSILEDIIAVEISRDSKVDNIGDGEEEERENPIAAAAAAKKRKSHSAMQQRIFGKTIVFTETKRDADELVSTGVFKSLTAQALHGDVGQKQRDATLNAFRQGAFNVLVATDVAGRGIDIQDVDLVVQFGPPRDPDTYVHRSGRTGRAGKKGTSVVLFEPNQARDIVKIERSLGHGFKFELVGPPSTEAALGAAAKTSAIASRGVPDETAKFFKEAAASLLAEGESPEDVVARCLAAISRRSTAVQSRSLLTGESGMATIEMSNSRGRPVSPGDVMFTVSKLSRMSRREGDLGFEGDVGKIQSNFETGTAVFDMSVEDAKRLVEFSKDIDAGGASFTILKQMDVERGRNFGMPSRRRDYNGKFQGRGNEKINYRERGGGGAYRGAGGGAYRRGNTYHGGSSSPNYESRHGGKDGRFRGARGRYDQGSDRRYEGRGGGDGW